MRLSYNSETYEILNVLLDEDPRQIIYDDIIPEWMNVPGDLSWVTIVQEEIEDSPKPLIRLEIDYTKQPNTIFEVPELFEIYRENLLKKMENLPKDYIYSFYDAGIQQTLTALYVDPFSSDNKKSMIQSIWNWINSVMAGYYQKKVRITEASTATELCDVELSLDAYTESKPDISLKDIMLAD